MGHNSQKNSFLSPSRIYTLKLSKSYPSPIVNGMFVFNKQMIKNCQYDFGVRYSCIFASLIS